MSYTEYVTSGLTSGLTTGFYSLFSNGGNVDCIKNLSDNQVLNIANDINSIFSETSLIENKPELSLPRLVVEGTQSSGKSTLLNRFMRMNILPTDKKMCTRTPLDIRLHKITSDQDVPKGWVEFGTYDRNFWTPECKIEVTVPTPTDEQITEIREMIQKKTIEYAGEGMNISSKPIILNIYSPCVPNLSFVDLPGLTMLACVDKGQPADIKQRIEDLVVSYIKQPRTIVLVVMQARADLETDLGMALIKKHDLEGQRTIGVLTKPDLMNSDSHVGDYLLNSNISKNLKLSHGYYVIRNRGGNEVNEMTLLQGFDLEKNYFTNHSEYKKSIYKNRVGMPNLTSNLSKILVDSISEMLPSVMTEIFALEAKINKKLDTMGTDLPDSKEGKVNVLNRYVSNFNARFLDSIESRKFTLNTGKQIKRIFEDFRTGMRDGIKPFNNPKVYNDDYFKNIVSNLEGNHMSYSVTLVKILEVCMTDEELNPIMLLKEPSLSCVDKICDLIINLINDISRLDEFARYPPLASHILAILIDNVISTSKINTKQKVLDLLQCEESYIWTNDKKIDEILVKQKYNSETLIDMLNVYFDSIKDVISHSVPKIIMKNIVRDIEDRLSSYLIQNVVSGDKINLLKEDEVIEQQRQYYSDLRTRIDSIKEIFTKNINGC